MHRSIRFSIAVVFTICALLAPGFCWCNENLPPIQVSHKDNVWTIEGTRQKATFNERTFEIAVRTPSAFWETIPSDVNDCHIKSGGESLQLALKQAGKKQFEPYKNGYMAGIKISLSDYPRPDKEDEPFDFSITLFVGLQGNEEDLICEMVPREGSDAIEQVHWPREFKSECFEATVVPFMQGMLLPKDWPKTVRLYDTVSYGRGLYMPWWGFQHGGDSVAAILETPEDGGCYFSHPAGGPTHMGFRWIHSLGKMSYPRRARLCFIDGGDYVDMAKRYRRHVIQQNRFVSLKEKIVRTPSVQKLIGSPVVHTSILYHIQPQSSYYDKDNPAKNHQIVSFDERAGQLRELSESGVLRAYVHLDGWGRRGYDNLHPDVLPPCPEAGGWEGMKRLSETCDEINFLFAIHDQYRDYYLDADSYDDRHTVVNQDGGRYFGSTWYGGKQSILCSRLAPGYVERNHTALLEHGVKLRGAYLDVFAVVPPDECYNPEHPVTRSQCLQYRINCFGIVRRLLGVVSSEEPADYAVPHLDLVHHGPYPLDPNPGKGPAMGIPVPLFNLVYHDSILLPWSLGKGEWGIPETDWGYLHGLLNAGIPYLSFNPDEETLKKIKALCALNERVGLLEMTGHQFLDESKRKQKTTYSDGTTVTVDFDQEEWTVDPPLEKEPTAFK